MKKEIFRSLNQVSTGRPKNFFKTDGHLRPISGPASPVGRDELETYGGLALTENQRLF